jgi:peptidoglycan/LPS O-acetylase OafA/YrhL
LIPESAKRFDELDSVRGLAALSVVFYHLRGVWIDNAFPGASDTFRRVVEYSTQPFCAGPEAVMLFFVLSGFVLSIPATNSRAQKYSVFVIRRICRIYMPYIVTLALAVAATHTLNSITPPGGDVSWHLPQGWSYGADDSWHFQPSWGLVLQHILFIGHYPTNTLDPPIWSLVLEMRISLLFPFLCAIVLSLGKIKQLLFALSLFFLPVLVSRLWHLSDGALDYLQSIHYAALFVVGIYLAQNRSAISTKFSHISKRNRIWIAILTALLFCYASAVFEPHFHRNFVDFLRTFGAVGIITFSLNSETCRRVLLWTPIHALGKMSYSIYLLHFIILLLFLHWFYGKISLSILLVLCLVAVIVASWIFYKLVEIPSINLGRKLSGYV